MKIIIDAMGGDNAPSEILQGSADAAKEFGVQIILVGDKEIIEKTASEKNISLDNLEIVHAQDSIAMDENPMEVVSKKRPDTSLAVALRLLANGGGDAFVSAGSTGAVLAGATLIVKRLKGIKRPALGTVFPGANGPWMLVDIGANTECRAEMLVQFAIMGSAYVEKVVGIKNPTVGLANNGAEETKGTPLQLETYPLLQKSKLNFIGNIEARDIPTGDTNVIVADGFTGNIILKLTEGVAKMFSGKIKAMFMQSFKTKIAALLLSKGLAKFKKEFDHTEYGGAPLLGVRKTVIKAHGSSNAKSFKNAIRQAVTCAQNKVPETIQDWVADYKEGESKA